MIRGSRASMESPALLSVRFEKTLPNYHSASRPQYLAGCDFFQSSTMPLAIKAIAHIAQAEGPVERELVLRRLAGWLGIQRITDRSRVRFDEALAQAVALRVVRRDGDVVWPPGMSATEFAVVRVPGPNEDDRRDMELIPLVERVNAVAMVLKEQFGLPRDELEREVAAMFGVVRLTTRTKEVVGEAVRAAIAAGLATDTDGRISVQKR
jgi:hypothetical protein